MSGSPDRLYELLPAIHRIRDSERGYPLQALLRVITEQLEVLENDIARLYDNWFIETCEDWVLPYIGDLIGYRTLHDAGEPGSAGENGGINHERKRNKILVPRRDVATTLASRRRKGTLSLVEQLGSTVAGWPARAVELYGLLGWTQHLNHQRLSRGQTAALRDVDSLSFIDEPFDRLAHSVDVRSIASLRSQGRYNIPAVGLFVWRLKPYSVTHAPAYCLENEGPQCFTFSILGNNTPLYTKPEREEVSTHIAGEINLPVPIRRRALEERINLRPLKTRASASYYGGNKSIEIYAPDWPVKDKDPGRETPQPIPPKFVIPADLSDWRYRAERNQVALDPVLGRIVFPTGQLPPRGVWVTYHYAFSADIGGGEYNRRLSDPVNFMLYRVTKDRPAPKTFDTIASALEQWRKEQREEQQNLGSEADARDKEKWREESKRLRTAVIEIGDSSVYSEPLRIALEANESLQLRAANRTRPVIRLVDNISDRPDAFVLSGKKASRFKLDGLTVMGRGLRIEGPDPSDPVRFAEGDLCDVVIRHSTLVPGWDLEPNCEPRRPNEPSLEIFNTNAKVVVKNSIIGSVYVAANEVQADPVEISITDSIVDATSEERLAIGAPSLPLAFAHLSVVRSTLIGKVNTHAIVMAEDSIFLSSVRVGRRQKGCMRFCYVAPGSRTPQRYHCQPDLVIAAIDEARLPLSPPKKAKTKERESERVKPSFESLYYGTPAYCQLASECAKEILRGAEDESELGVFHDLFNPQRISNLRARLDEYTPAGMEVGILFKN